MDAVLMCRVSDPKQEDEFSLDNQEREGKEYAHRAKLELVRAPFVFQETASKPNQRKKFDEIIALIYERTKAKGARVALLVEKHDRLLRNHEDSMEIQRLVVAGRLEVHFFKMGKVLNKNSDPSEFLVNDVMTSVNTYQARTIGREAAKGMKEKAMQGWLPNKAPLGYANVERDAIGKRSGRDTTESIVAPDPDRRFVRWAQRIWELAADGVSIREIRRKCIEEGVVPAERVATFSKSLVENTLKNPFYGGTFMWGGVEYDGKHELIIPREVFERVRTRESGNTKRKRTHDGALAGFLHCGECGCSITYDPKTKPSGLRFDYYRCANGKGAHEKLKYFAEAVILSRFEPVIDSITLTEAQAKEITDALNSAHHKAQDAKRRQMEGFRAGLKELENGEDELYVDLKRGVLDDEGYKRQLARVRSERLRFTGLLEQAQQAIDGAYLKTAQGTLELATRVKSLWVSRSAEERRAVLEKLLSNPLLDATTVRYDLKKPYRAIVKMARSANLLPE